MSQREIEEMLLQRVKVISKVAISKELFADLRVEIHDDGGMTVADYVAIRMISGYLYLADGQQTTRKRPLSRWEHLKRALLPARFATWHPLDNGQPIFERVYLSPGSSEEFDFDRAHEALRRVK